MIAKMEIQLEIEPGDFPQLDVEAIRIDLMAQLSDEVYFMTEQLVPYRVVSVQEIP